MTVLERIRRDRELLARLEQAAAVRAEWVAADRAASMVARP